MKKVFTPQDVRALEHQWSQGEISYNKMADILNERANSAFAPAPTNADKIFEIGVLFDNDRTSVVSEIKGLDVTEVELILDTIITQWEIDNKPKRTMPDYEHLEGLERIAAISGYLTEELEKLRS